MKKLRYFFSIYWPALLILSVWLILVVANFKPGTWLSGWDNLHPEFDFIINIRRSFSAVWQEYQGVGMLGGMGYASDLSHQLFLWGLSLILPVNTLRYAWHFLMLLIGPLGVLAFTALLVKKSNSQPKLSFQLASLVASLFYLLNLATVQYFYAPFETFSSFYGFFPWLLFSAVHYLQTKSKRDLAIFFLISLAASSAFYVETLFVVYSCVLALFVIASCIPFTWQKAKHALLLLFITLMANAFWLVPSLYFTVTSAQVTVNAQQNRISTPEVQYMNQYYGTLPNISLLKGYWFTYLEFDANQQTFNFLLEPWRSHISQQPVVVIGYLLFGLVVIGIAALVIQKRFRHRGAVLVAFLLVMLLLTAGNGFFGSLFTFFSDHIPLFGQIFRTVFTKWSIVAAFIYSLGLFSFLLTLFSILDRTKWAALRYLAVLILGSALVYFTWPLFTGNLFDNRFQSQIPHEYFDLFSFFKTQPLQNRIALLPVQSQWGWNLYTWDYVGSGYLWHGIEQPELNRAFDVWSPYNETFYHQISDAVYSNDPQVLAEVLKKYQVSYLVLDESVIDYNHSTDFLHIPESKTLLTAINAQPVWHEGDLTVFKTPYVTNNFVTAPAAYNSIKANTLYGNKDMAYTQFGDYLTDLSSQADQIYLPFSDVFSSQVSGVTASNDQVILSRPVFNSQQNHLVIPALKAGDVYVTPAQVTYTGQEIRVTFPQMKATLQGQAKLLPQLAPWTISTPQQAETIVWQILDQQTTLHQNEPQNISLDLPVNQDLETFSFNLQDIDRSESKLEIDESKVIFTTIPASVWQTFLVDQVLDFMPSNSTNSKIEVSVPTPAITVDPSSSFDANCDTLKRGSFEKVSNGQSTVYRADNFAILCSTFALKNISIHGSYLVHLVGDNLQGRSLRVYAYNQQNQRSDIEEIMNPGDFDTFLSLSAWPLLPDNYYNFNIETRSFGDLAENNVKQIQIYSIPLTYLSRLYLTSSPLKSQPVANTTILKGITKRGTYSYKVDLKSDTQSGVIALAQGYDRAWLALTFNKPTTLPTILDHYQYDGWANAWSVPANTQVVYLFYWPQLLEFLGLALLPLTALAFLLSHHRK